MDAAIRNLLAIQEIDSEILRVQRTQARYAKSRDVREAEVQRARDKAEEVCSHIADLEKRVREAERQVAEWRENLNKFLAQQAAVKTQKEYDALTHEIGETEQHISQADEQGISFLEEEDELVQNLEHLEKDLAAREQEFEEELERIREREAEYAARTETLTARRSELSADVDPGLMRRYERLNTQFPGLAVVPIEGENCGGCHMRVVTHRIQEASSEEAGAVECNACHRFIYVMEE